MPSAFLPRICGLAAPLRSRRLVEGSLPHRPAAGSRQSRETAQMCAKTRSQTARTRRIPLGAGFSHTVLRGARRNGTCFVFQFVNGFRDRPGVESTLIVRKWRRFAPRVNDGEVAHETFELE